MQMNLLVGSYFKHEYGAAEALKQAFDLINWWRWHLVPFEWLLLEMDHSLALLTGCLTRWGSQVAAIIRLLQFKQSMQVVLVRRKQEILNTLAKKDQRDRAAAILSVAQKDEFWSSLAHLVQNLLPVRIALRVLESDNSQIGLSARTVWQNGKSLQLQPRHDGKLGEALGQDGSQALPPCICSAPS